MGDTNKFPSKLRFLFRPSRYKVAYGGRSSAKSWSFARALLLFGVNRKIRVLCCREVQKSIKDSVKKLLDDQITAMGLEAIYESKETTIVNRRNGTEFLFVGLSELTADSIKSYEGVDICWVEEGQTITDRSWKILIPTIRKETFFSELKTIRDPSYQRLNVHGKVMYVPEIWISFNPDLDTDPTYVRFVSDPPEDCISVEVNWRDNPWFNETMEKERQDCLRLYPKDYNNIWEGKCRPAVEGAIYYDEVMAMERDRRVCNVPYDAMLKVHIVIDLGFNGTLSAGMIQKHTSEIRFLRYYQDEEGSQRTLADFSAEWRELKYNWGKIWLPFADGFSKDVKRGESSFSILTQLGWSCAKKQEVANAGVEEGIRQTRLVFPRFYIDKTNCRTLIESWKRYRRHINKQNMTAGAPEHDVYSHGGDMTRYVAVNLKRMTNDADDKPAPIAASYGALDPDAGY